MSLRIQRVHKKLELFELKPFGVNDSCGFSRNFGRTSSAT
ncbi:hypothetical protein T190611E02C_10625 [Tenacibaculum sp. 190524A05c]